MVLQLKEMELKNLSGGHYIYNIPGTVKELAV
jgi:hypothetical protein